MGAATAPAGALPDDRGGAAPADAPLTVGRLAASVGLSRATLLYYDRLGLLRPSSRTAAGYRRYSPADAARLDAICRLRRTGLPLETIGRLLDSPAPDLVAALALRLAALDEQIAGLRAQQRRILDALTRGEEAGRAWVPDRAALVALLDGAGLSAPQRAAWHAAAERADGPRHQALLAALGLANDEAAAVRRWRDAEPGATVEP